MIDFLGIVAARKANIDGWQWCNSKRVGGGFVLEGGVPRALKSGPRRGTMTWRDTALTSVCVIDEELAAEYVRWELEHQKCYRCEGSGLAWWSKTSDKCRRCDGLGVPWP